MATDTSIVNTPAASPDTPNQSAIAAHAVNPLPTPPVVTPPASTPTTITSANLGAASTPNVPTGGTTSGAGGTTPPNAAATAIKNLPPPPTQPLTADEQAAKDSVAKLSSGISTNEGNLAGQAADTAAITAPGSNVATLTATLQGYNNTITQKSAELAAFDQQNSTIQGNIAQQPVAMSIITGQQAEQARQSAVTRASMVSEIGLLNAQVQATQGNIALATKTAQDAVDAKYAPIKEQIAIQQAQLAAIQPLLDSADKKTAANQAIATDAYSKQVDATIQAAKDSQTTLLSLVQGGAPASFVAGLQGKSEADILSTPGAAQYLASGNYTHFTDPLTGQTVIYNTKTGKAAGSYGTSGSSPAAVTALPNANTAVVAPGQGLFQIAQANGTDVATLQSLNPGVTVDANGVANLVPGQKINLPPKDSTTAPFQQYGLLTKTNFNPTSQTDQNAQRYLQQYLQGNVPSARTLGLTGAALTLAATRASNLYSAATGNPMPPNPDIFKSNTKLVEANNKLLNNLSVQSDSITKNFGLNLQNASDAKINQFAPQILNGVINNINAAFSDPATMTYLLQNSTLQNEASNLLAVRNASGTTVYDKMVGAGLIPKNASLPAQAEMMKKLMQEAQNVSSSIKSANAGLYQSIDPLQMNPDNPNRQTYQQTQAVSGMNFTLGNGFDLSTLNFKFQ